jgi:hypothetical protein
MKAEIHALSMKTLSPQEWAAQAAASAASPSISIVSAAHRH